MYFSTRYRTSPGVDGDTIYSKRHIWLRWLPNWVHLGWYPYANVASARNRQVIKLNRKAQEFLDDLDDWAEMCAAVQEDKAHMEQGRTVNQFGIGEVERLPRKEIKQMLPYTLDVDPTFKKIIQQHVVDRALQLAGVSDKKKKSGKNKVPDMMLTSKDGVKSAQGSADHVWGYESDDSSGRSKKGQNRSKQEMNEIKENNPREEGESRQDWNNRIQKL